MSLLNRLRRGAATPTPIVQRRFGPSMQFAHPDVTQTVLGRWEQDGPHLLAIFAWPRLGFVADPIVIVMSSAGVDRLPLSVNWPLFKPGDEVRVIVDGYRLEES